MSAVSDFREPVRYLIGDHDDAARMYDDATLDRGIRVTVKGGRLAGYTLSSDNMAINPDVPDGDMYLLLSAKVALGFISSVPSRSAIRTRAFSEAIGDYSLLVQQLEQLIRDVEDGGTGCFGWQNYMGWIEGYSGLRRSWAWMTRLKYEGPLATVTYTAAGQLVAQ